MVQTMVPARAAMRANDAHKLRVSWVDPLGVIKIGDLLDLLMRLAVGTQAARSVGLWTSWLRRALGFRPRATSPATVLAGVFFIFRFVMLLNRTPRDATRLPESPSTRPWWNLGTAHDGIPA